ncbi:NAD-dependent epimerase/dehydratase family protein [Streptomyces sp. NPDC048291]|uniref:NAD-dependent epimerase/dehydratase family protein n=1 Tax=Streptomyces sp. NPDC048291 TaxID=3365530 RepID=UPI003712333A
MLILVTGGAGFIGSQIVTALIGAGHGVRVLDDLLPTAHRTAPAIPKGVDWRHADIRDREAVADTLRGADAVCHQAAMVGLGKEFADAPDYVGCNDLGTAVLLAGLAAAGVQRLVPASSMVIYGEGRYECTRHGVVRPGPRRTADLEAGGFEPPCPHCGEPLVSGLLGGVAGLPEGGLRAYNVGSGDPHTVGEMAAALAESYGGPTPVVTGEYRLGDVRHITPRSQRLRDELGWNPRVVFEEDMAEFAAAPLRAG